MGRVVHFELGADDPERAGRFYSEVFGWAVQKWAGPEDYWLVQTGPDDQPGINGGFFRKRPGATCINTIAVASVDESSARITEAGGRIIAPKMAIPGIGYLAYGQDPEGNTFGIMQRDPSAA